MKRFFTTLATMTVSAMVSFSATANDELLIEKIKPLGVSSIEIKPSPMTALKSVLTNEGIFYVSEDGQYLIQGKMYQLTSKGPVDVSNMALMDKLNSFQDEMIIYPAKNEKYVVTVFTDITCPYCQNLHKHMQEYNDLGITVRYLAYPRKGIVNNMTASQMESIWSAKNPVLAMDKYQQGSIQVPQQTPEIVKKQYELGLQFDVRGTPTIVTEKGEVFTGYIDPQALFIALEQ